MIDYPKHEFIRIKTKGTQKYLLNDTSLMTPVVRQKNRLDENGHIVESFYFTDCDEVYHFKFDEAGRKTSQCHYYYYIPYDPEDEDKFDTSCELDKTEFEYDHTGKIIEQRDYDFRDSFNKINFKYKKGELIEQEEKHSLSTYLSKKTYFKNSLIIKKEKNNSQTGITVSTTLFDYDSNGNLIEKKESDQNGLIKSRHTKQFNQNNDLIEECEYLNNTLKSKKTYEYSKENQRSITNEYDSKGNRIKTVYDEYSQKIEKINYRLDGAIFSKTTYDKNGGFYKEETQYIDGKKLVSKKYNSLNKVIEICSFNLDGILSKKLTYKQDIVSDLVNKNEYDSDDCLIRKVIFKKENGVVLKVIENFETKTIYEVDFDNKGKKLEERILNIKNKY